MKKLFEVTSAGTVNLSEKELTQFESNHIEDIICVVRMSNGNTLTLKGEIHNNVAFSELED